MRFCAGYVWHLLVSLGNRHMINSNDQDSCGDVSEVFGSHHGNADTPCGFGELDCPLIRPNAK